MADPLSVDSHFDFGENWKSFARIVNAGRISQAEVGMRRLFPSGELSGARFLDVGCGSGLSSLVAARLGASRVDAVDIDAASVEAARTLLARFGPPEVWSVRVGSVFDLSPEKDGLFDIVYSWGVLHHTGAMWRAVTTAASLVRPGGLLALALYRKTLLCGFWRREKAFYSRAPSPVQAVVRALYKGYFFALSIAVGRNPLAVVRSYGERGMDWSHDIHDWLGGYPYESTSPDEVADRLDQMGFSLVRSFPATPGRTGLLGSACDEYVAVRRPDGREGAVSTSTS
jgi:2-polyprenyl-6-hydroxyphenyl methylase/3-demethylubiquinone-9 3-methyltransferase